MCRHDSPGHEHGFSESDMQMRGNQSWPGQRVMLESDGGSLLL